MAYSQRVLRRLVAYAIVTLSACLPQDVVGAITVHTHDGRIITGEVDAQTDSQRLWIRQEKQQILLTSSFYWSEITAAVDGTDNLPLEQLPELLQARMTGEPQGFILHQTIYHETAACADGCQPSPVNVTQQRLRRRRIRSLEVEAYLVNLDRDVEPDGIQLIVAALDENGLPVPVKGSLSAKLWGERIQPHGSLVRYERNEQWSQRVEPEDFVDGLAGYPLRFRKINPEFDTALHSEALVNVRLSVFGQGNFEASVPVQIRSFNPVRDRLQLTRGSRFFPQELTENVRHQLPHRTHTRRVRTR